MKHRFAEPETLTLGDVQKELASQIRMLEWQIKKIDDAQISAPFSWSRVVLIAAKAGIDRLVSELGKDKLIVEI